MYCVKQLARICAEAEQCLDYRALYDDLKKFTPRKRMTQMETLASSAVATTLTLPVDLIIVLSESGRMARYVAKYKPSVPILAATSDFVVFKNLGVVRGVIPHEFKSDAKDMNALIEQAQQMNLVKGPCKIITLLEADSRDYSTASELKIVDIE